ncbi:Phosphoacetylglucosamine mutase [Atractiella rhizophila]|nr:Phosphoacetylglucosamine mutase [Atractiella rhizophila]
MDDDLIKTTSAKHPLPGVKLAYGTAGFRTLADDLDSTMFRVGMLAALRSKCFGGQMIGVMVTASHNPERDNGVKLVDPKGEMLQVSWEGIATKLANSNDTELLQTLTDLVEQFNINLSNPANVVVGFDTRPSSPDLIASVKDGLRCFSATIIDAGLCTTPQLHYLVRAHNSTGTSEAYGPPTEDGYYSKLSNAFKALVVSQDTKIPTSVTVDCANGVGAPKLKALIERLNDLIDITIAGDAVGRAGALNSYCGADYVKTTQSAPKGLSIVPMKRYCSFDGDADRIVYYYALPDNTFRLLDGDKIAALVATHFIELIRQAGLSLELAVVQTAYANGSSTVYLTEKLNVSVSCVPTGVKHLHHEAEKFDIGVYFEANGHGTVLFSPKATNMITGHLPSDSRQSTAIHQLRNFVHLINQTVGDALSDMLMVEAVLHSTSMDVVAWDALYTDLPNRLVKVIVKDRFAFATKNAERTLTAPTGLQGEIDEIVRKVPHGRSFVRPSGTEDCVRVYAEALSSDQADWLAFAVAGKVFDAWGKGDKPSEFL